jgi:hypothetical protein
MKNLVILFGLLFGMILGLQAQPSYDFILKNDLPLDKSYVLEIDDNHLFFAKNNVLFILDITDPEALVLRKELVLESIPSDIKVIEDKLFVALDRKGVYCYDIGVIDAPLILGYYEVDYLYQRMAIHGNEVCLIHSDGIEVIDFNNPSQPELLNYISMTTMPTAITQYEDYLLVSSFDELSIIDIHTPEFPSIVYTMDIPFASDMEVIGNIAILATMNNIYSVDLANILYPEIINNFKDPFQISKMDVENNNLYGCSASGNLVILRVEEGAVSVLQGINNSEQYQDILVDNNYAYLINKRGGLDVYNVSNLLDIRKVAHFDEALYPQVYFVF